MTIGFILFHRGIGDYCVAFKALYLMKHIYGARIVVFGNKAVCNLLEYASYIDQCEDIGELNQKSVECINSYHCDCAILVQARSKSIKALESSNIKKVITPLKLRSLISPKCRTSIWLFLRHRMISMTDVMCELARYINPKLYDKHIAEIKIPAKHISTAPKHKKAISEFLTTNCPNREFVIINPFSVSAFSSLSLEGFLELIERFEKRFSKYVPLVITYPAVHTQFMQNLKDSKRSFSSLVVFENNDDLLYLVEMVDCAKCVISPSTGVIHIASCLHIPTIGLFSKRDIVHWGTLDKCYVEIPKPLSTINKQEEEIIIEETLRVFGECCAK